MKALAVNWAKGGDDYQRIKIRPAKHIQAAIAKAGWTECEYDRGSLFGWGQSSIPGLLQWQCVPARAVNGGEA